MKKRVIIGLCGFATCGKDAIGSILTVYHSFERLSFADALKAEAIDEGWDGTKSEAGRQLLQELGAKRRKQDPNYWIRRALDRMDTMGDRIVITDVRYGNEIGTIRDRGGLLWRVIRPGVGPANDHISETDHLRFTPDAYIHNGGGLAALRITVEHHLREAGLC